MLSTKKLIYKVLTKLNAPLTVRTVTGSIGRTYNSATNIAAPTVNGYTFLCWIGVNSDGWLGSINIANYLSQTTSVWTLATNGSGNGNLMAYALYVKD